MPLSVPVPETLEEAMSPVWLNAALGQRFPEIRVTSVTPGPIVSRVSTNARFRITCEPDLPPGLPDHLCIKGYFSDLSEWAVLSRTAGEPEALFYRELAEFAGVRTLRSFYADIDPTTHHGVVISDDVVQQGARFLDALSDFTPDQAAQSLEQYAVLHGRTWGWEQLADPRLSPRVAATLRARGVPEIRGNFDGPIGAGVPSEIRDADRLVNVVGLLQKHLISAEPRLPPPWRRAYRQLVPRRRWAPVPGGLAVGPARAVVSRRGLPHCMRHRSRRPPSGRTRPPHPLPRVSRC